MTHRREFLKSIGLTAASLAGGSLVRAEADRSPGGRAARPNVILIVSDEHQAATCGCYGSKVRRVDGRSPTPHIDALAGEGVRFDSMYCPSPLCAPSRAAYMTGAYPHTTTALYHKMQAREAGLSRFPGVRADLPGMGEYFRRAGYRTAAIGKVHVHGEQVHGWDLGFDERALRFYTRGPGMHYDDLKNGDLSDRYREKEPYLTKTYREIDARRFAGAPADLKVKGNGVNQHRLETLVEHEDEMFDHLVTDRSIDFIRRQATAGQPFLIHVGLEKPHRPWTVHQKFLDRFNPDDIPLPATVAEWVEKGMHPFTQGWCHSGVTGDAARNSMAAYYACASQVDDCVGRIVDACRDLGLLENSILIYTSDHGESLYEHGLIEKHNMLDPAARVPFVIRAPWAFPAADVCTSPASLIDLIPTLCEMTSTPGASALEGVSLLPSIAGEADPDRIVFSEFYQEGSCTRKDEFMPVRMGLNRTHKYIYTHAAADQLYLRGTDDEAKSRNRAFEPVHEALVSQLKLCTLHGWELDEYPMLTARAAVQADGVHLTWEAAAPRAHYDVYRSASRDPRHATRLAQGLTECGWTDSAAAFGATYFYWVLGHYDLDQPFVDPSGKARFGAQPLISRFYPRSLPVSPCVEVVVRGGFSQSFAYQAVQGSVFAGREWIHIGMPPSPTEEGVNLTGPVTVLSPHPLSGPIAFSAEIQTLRPGPGKRDALQLLFGYLDMHRYYAVTLQRDGVLVLSKRSGEWSEETLGRATNSGVALGEWQTLQVSFNGGAIEIRLNGQRVFTAQGPHAYAAGRFGFDVPLHVTSARVRSFGLVDL